MALISTGCVLVGVGECFVAHQHKNK